MAHRVLGLTLLVCVLATGAFGTPTRNNDDSCDIAALPAATLLLPYFEVDLSSPNGPTTLFTVINASAQEQIAHVTLWTDYAFPVIDFNVYLTGYDVQSINLYDIIVRGIIAPDFGTGPDVSHIGPFSDSNPRLDLTDCGSLPGRLPDVYVARMQSAFTLGRVAALGQQFPECTSVGGTHSNAIGYATIDVVRSCTARNPAQQGYLTEDILWDNVLMGDYQQVDRAKNLSESGPMVHVRAVPEGGTASERRNFPGQYEVSFHRTFYSRLLPSTMQTFDARQPLPSVFAARWIEGSEADFQTYFKIWREGRTTVDAPCDAYVQNVAEFLESVNFDEDENPEGMYVSDTYDPPIFRYPSLPATAFVRSRDTNFIPRPTSGAISGWVYFNLDNDLRDDYASQNWIVVSMRAEGQFSTDMDAFSLGNGCTPPVAESEVKFSYGSVIGPANNINP